MDSKHCYLKADRVKAEGSQRSTLSYFEHCMKVQCKLFILNINIYLACNRIRRLNSLNIRYFVLICVQLTQSSCTEILGVPHGHSLKV